MTSDLKVVPLPCTGSTGIAVSTDPLRGRDGLEVKNLRVVARPHLLNAERHIGCLPVGLTLAEIVQECYRRGDVPANLRTGAIVQVNGEIVPREMWARIRPKECANVCVSVSLGDGGDGGGKNPIAIVMTIAVIVAAIYLGPEVAVALGFTEAGSAAAIATFAIATVGTYAVNAMFPARLPGMGGMGGLSAQTYNDSPTYSITGAQNQANPYGPIPVILGRHRFTPPLGARAYTEISGNDEYLRIICIRRSKTIIISMH